MGRRYRRQGAYGIGAARINDGKRCDIRQSGAPSNPLHDGALHGQLPRPGERRICRAHDEQGSRLYAGDVWLGRRDFLLRLFPFRGAEQRHHDACRRAALDRAHHGDMGRDFGGRRIRANADELLRLALSLGAGGSWLRARHDLLSVPVVSIPYLGRLRIDLSACHSAHQRDWRANFGTYSEYGRISRTAWLAMAVHFGSVARIAFGHRGIFLSAGWSGGRMVLIAARAGDHCIRACRRAARERAYSWRDRCALRLPGRLVVRSLFRDCRWTVWDRLLAAADRAGDGLLEFPGRTDRCASLRGGWTGAICLGPA